jgi:hypothetical protein
MSYLDAFIEVCQQRKVDYRIIGLHRGLADYIASSHRHARGKNNFIEWTEDCGYRKCEYGWDKVFPNYKPFEKRDLEVEHVYHLTQWWVYVRNELWKRRKAPAHDSRISIVMTEELGEVNAVSAILTDCLDLENIIPIIARVR